MSLFNNAAEMTFEVTVKEKLYDSVLRNFFADGEDLPLHTGQRFPGGLAHASKENILKKIWDNSLVFWIQAYRADSKNSEKAEEREIFSAVADTLEKLEYSMVKKELVR